MSFQQTSPQSDTYSRNISEIYENEALVKARHAFLGDPFEDAAQYLTKAFNEDLTFFTFGWGREIDERTMGIEPENLVIVGGDTKAGKTTHAVNTVGRNIQAGHKVLVFTTEVTSKQYIIRLACWATGISIVQVRKNALTTEQKSLLFKAIYRLREGRLLAVVDRPFGTISDLEDAVYETEPNLVVVDHLQRLNPEHEQFAVGYKYISQRLKQIAVQNEIGVLTLSQIRLQPEWFSVSESGHFHYELNKMSTAWTKEPLGEGDKILFLHNLGRDIPQYNGFGNIIYHSLRDYESGGYDTVPLNYAIQKVGRDATEESPRINGNNPY